MKSSQYTLVERICLILRSKILIIRKKTGGNIHQVHIKYIEDCRKIKKKSFLLKDRLTLYIL